jgi:hypothetical protein
VLKTLCKPAVSFRQACVRVAETAFSTGDGRPICLSVSVGAAIVQASDTEETLFKQADAPMYQGQDKHRTRRGLRFSRTMVDPGGRIPHRGMCTLDAELGDRDPGREVSHGLEPLERAIVLGDPAEQIGRILGENQRQYSDKCRAPGMNNTPSENYSCRSAVMGSTRMARRAGR